MRIDEDSTDLHDVWMGDLLSMSDQADGLRQLVQARTASGSGGTAVADPPAAARMTGTPPPTRRGRWS